MKVVKLQQKVNNEHYYRLLTEYPHVLGRILELVNAGNYDELNKQCSSLITDTREDTRKGFSKSALSAIIHFSLYHGENNEKETTEGRKSSSEERTEVQPSEGTNE